MSIQAKHATRFSVTGAALLLSACASGTEVELVNRTTDTLDNVSVQFTGGATALREIPVGAVARVSLDPKADSHLENVYRLQTGWRRCRIDTYIAPGDRAAFRIELLDRSCRVTREKISRPGLFGRSESKPSPAHAFPSPPMRAAT